MANKSMTEKQLEAQKGNLVSNADPFKPYKFWKTMTVNPAGSALAATALAGGAAYLTAPHIAKLLGKFNKHLPQSWQGADLQTQDTDAFRKRLTWMAALGAGGLSVLSNINTDKPWKSMMDWNYGKKAPGKTSTPSGGLQSKNAEPELSKEQIIHKMASLGLSSNPAVLAMDIIPLDHAKEIVSNDKYLSSSQKAAISTIFDRTSSDTQSGNTSMADLTAGALRAGLGFAGGAIAGYALGKIFSLPTGVTRVASVTGGLANALRASGLIT